MTTVLIAEDHHLVRQGIRALLEKDGGIQVVGEAADGNAALEQVQKLLPDVLLMDIAMPQLNGAEAVRRLAAMKLRTRVLMLSMYSDETLVRQALQSGARGYLLKQSVAGELIQAVRTVHQGGIFLSSKLPASLRDACLRPEGIGETRSGFERLTSREREVLQLVAEGNTSKAIGLKLGLSEKTIEKHRAQLMKKLGVHDTAGMVRAAIKHRITFIDT
ncbi:MAG TPA: response regulator transcription factor [Verrucomicrobiae bacterium]|nr:response regulator transcription factor [Verrucomicrobiae bacterium]